MNDSLIDTTIAEAALAGPQARRLFLQGTALLLGSVSPLGLSLPASASGSPAGIGTATRKPAPPAGDDLIYTQGGRTFRSVLMPRSPAAPARAGVMIVPDWRGLSPFARHQAQQLALAGHDVVLVDLYGDGLYADDESQAASLLKVLIEDRASGVARMQACLAAFLGKAPAAKIVVLGYSVGGMVSLDFGRAGAPIAGIALCSALLKAADAGQPARIGVPVMALHGTQDVVCPAPMVQALVEEMDRVGNDFRIVLYGQTHHAFYNPLAGTDPAARLVYSERSAKRADAEISRFLEQF